VCALALDFLAEEDFPQRNLLQSGGKRPQEEKRGCSGGVLLLFGGGYSRESCGDIWISVEKGISRRANYLVFAPAVFYSSRAPHGCSALREILLLEEIQGYSLSRRTTF
jgi:hypothetical protein